MLKHIRELFAPQNEAPAVCTPERLQVAVSVLLLEVAGADSEFSAGECEKVIDLLRERFGLDQEDAEELIRVAQERREETYDLYQFTKQINECCSVSEKEQIIREIWRIIYADQNLDAHEDYLVHKLARLLNLTHQQLIEAKMDVREELHKE
jgi:uncharacterized tellurite resistance protein B-like protein